MSERVDDSAKSYQRLFIRSLERNIAKFSTCKITIFQLVSVAEQTYSNIT